MAKECSFDIVSEYNKQELVNAIDQVKRELTSRFDLKNSNSEVAEVFKAYESEIVGSILDIALR